MNSKYNFLIASKDFNPYYPSFVKGLEVNGFTKVINHDGVYRIFEHNTKDCSIYVLCPQYDFAYSLKKLEPLLNYFDGFVVADKGFPDFFINRPRGIIMFNTFYELMKYINLGIPDKTPIGKYVIEGIAEGLNSQNNIDIQVIKNYINSIYGIRSSRDLPTTWLRRYCEEDIKGVNEMYSKLLERKNTMNKYFEIKKVIFNDPATIIFWKDGTKTVTKCGEKDFYDPEKGLAMCLAKRALGDKGNYYETFKKWLPEETTEPEFLKKKFNISVDLASATDKDTKAMQKLSDVLIYDGHKEAKANIAENKYGDRYDTRLFFAGKKHKIVCAGDCYHVKNIKKENSLVYRTLKDAIEDGCTPCKHCKGVHKQFIPEGLRSCRNCKHREECTSFLPCYNSETNVFENFEEDK